MKAIRASTSAAALLLAAGHSFAADAIVYDPVPEPPAVVQEFDWTGPYIGLFGGLAVGEMGFDARQLQAEAPAETFGIDVTASGFLGGVQAGYDWQFNNIVVGALADIAFTSYEAGVTASSNGVEVFHAESQLNYLGTVRGRVGHAWDRTLLYGHGGFAYGQTEQEITLGGGTLFNGEQTRTGWTIGAGLEHALTDRISFGTEYAYVDLGSETVYSDVPNGLTIEDDVSFHTLKAIVNFRF